MSVLISLIKDIFARKQTKNEIVSASNLDASLYEQSYWNDVISRSREMLAINPDHVDALFNLGVAYEMQKRSEAFDCYQRVLALDPQHFAAKINLLHRMQHQCEWNGLKAGINKIRKAVYETSKTRKNQFPPFIFMSLPGTTAMEQKHCAERFVQFEYKALFPLRDKLGFKFDRMHNEKIHIGYLSADLRQHPVSFLMAETFELHDRSRFHITAYSYGPDDGSAMRKRLENAFDSFVDIQNDQYEEAAKKIYTDHIDVLVDLTGHTQNSRSGIMALRPAPIQVNYLGYPGTMGADFVDYLIADQFVVPQGHQKYYTEKVVWMPDCFLANDRTRPRLAPPTRSEYGLPETSFVFCCFNQTFKITPVVFDIWCRLLKAVPDSVLWLSANNQQAKTNLLQEARNRGVEAERIIMASKLPELGAHLARLQCADLFLDTTPYNAHTTCSDALWMGLPVLTCAGETFPSRVAGSLLTAMGVPELITYNMEDYYRLALDLATNREKLRAVRSKIIANRDTAPLFDSKRFTRNLEQAYIQMMADMELSPVFN